MVRLNDMTDKITHLTEREIDKLIQEEEGITIRGYLDLLQEIELIRKTTKELEDERTIQSQSVLGY